MKASNDILLSIFKKGSGKNIPLVILPGLACSKEQWSLQANYFSRDRVVLAVDLPGQGRSPALKHGDYSPRPIAEAIFSAVQSKKISSFILMGHSMGGNLAVVLAGMYPKSIEKMILVDSTGDMLRLPRKEAATINKSLAPTAYKTTAHTWFRSLIGHLAPKQQKRIFADLEKTPREVFVGYWDAFSRCETVKSLRKLADRTVCIDRKASVAAYSFSRLVPRVRKVELLDVGHWPQIEIPDRFNSLVEKFIQEK